MIVQQYIIVMPDKEIFSTDWYDYEKHYVEGSIIIDTLSGDYSTDGYTWKEVEEDHL